MSDIKTRYANGKDQFSRDGENWFDSIEKYDEFYVSKVIEYGVKAMGMANDNGNIMNNYTKSEGEVNIFKCRDDAHEDKKQKFLDVLEEYERKYPATVHPIYSKEQIDKSREEFFRSQEEHRKNIKIESHKTTLSQQFLDAAEIEAKINPEVIPDTKPEVVYFNPLASCTAHSYNIGGNMSDANKIKHCNSTLNEVKEPIEYVIGLNHEAIPVYSQEEKDTLVREVNEAYKRNKIDAFAKQYGGKVKLPQPGDNMNTDDKCNQSSASVDHGYNENPPMSNQPSNQKNPYLEKVKESNYYNSVEESCSPMMGVSQTMLPAVDYIKPYSLTVEQQVRLEVFKTIIDSDRPFGEKIEELIVLFSNTIINGTVNSDKKR